jgi:hypothetical protein
MIFGLYDVNNKNIFIGNIAETDLQIHFKQQNKIKNGGNITNNLNYFMAIYKD